MFPHWRDWNVKYTTKGLWKMRLQFILKALAFVGTLTVALKMRSLGMTSVESVVMVFKLLLRSAIGTGISFLKSVQGAL